MRQTRTGTFLGLVAIVLFAGLLAAAPARADYAYYYPYFANLAGTDMIGLALTNTTDQAAKVTIVIKDQGGVVQAVENWNLQVHGQKADVIGGDLDCRGSFVVYSNQPLTGLCFLFTNNVTAMYDVPGTQKLSSKLVFPQVAQSDNWDTGIAVSNPGSTDANLVLQYRTPAGEYAGTPKALLLKAGQSTIIPVAEIITGKEDGAIELTSTGGKVAAYAVYNNFKENNGAGTFSAGLNAINPDDQDNNYTPPDRSQYAAIAAAAADFSSGAHAMVGVEPPREAQLNLLPTVSDIIMAADGPDFYRIERFQSDSIIKFAAADPARVIWQHSTNDQAESEPSDPHDLIFVNGGHGTSTKAYVPRYGSTKLWVVNPQEATDAAFKLGEIDLSAYADADGSPEMHRGVVVDGKLFLLLQRLDKTNNFEPGEAYVAVIDIATDQEIDTRPARAAGGGAAEPKGIPLPVKNPWTIAYNSTTGKIYIQAVGRFPNSWAGTPAQYSGGIITLDPDNYEVKMLVDDGDSDNHPYGNFSGMTLVSGDRGYFITYAGWGDNALWGFDPATGDVDAAPIAAFAGGSAITTIAADGHGKLWVGGGNGTVTVLDPASGDAVEQVIHLNLNPTTNGIAFGTYAEPEEEPQEPGSGSGGGSGGGS